MFIMKWTELSIVRAACAYFFLCPGLTYGVLTARLPALKIQTGADESQLGLMLLCLGLASLAALLSSSYLITRWGSRVVLTRASLILLIAIPLCCLAQTPIQLGAGCLLTGASMGLVDVAVNTQGIQIEHRYRTSCMSFMHAAYSLGGVTGSLAGAVCAGFGLSPFINAVCLLGLYACFRVWAAPRLLNDVPASSTEQKDASSGTIPLFVVVCGVLAMLAYASEGSVAEWGSLLLFTVKGAEEHTAALVFAAFSVTTVFCRLFGDRLRHILSDFILMLGGSLLALSGMLLVLLSPSPAVCLAGYALMGTGLSPIVPILFSRAGSCPGISAGKASAVVSLLSYSGLLFFPPMLGFIAHKQGLEKALLTIIATCLCLALGSFLFRSQRRRNGKP